MCQFRRSDVFIVNFAHTSHLFLVFLLLPLNKYMLACKSKWFFLPRIFILDNHDILSMKFYELGEDDNGADYSNIVPKASNAEGERGKKMNITLNYGQFEKQLPIVLKNKTQPVTLFKN